MGLALTLDPGLVCVNLFWTSKEGKNQSAHTHITGEEHSVVLYICQFLQLWTDHTENKGK